MPILHLNIGAISPFKLFNCTRATQHFVDSVQMHFFLHDHFPRVLRCSTDRKFNGMRRSIALVLGFQALWACAV